MSILHVVLDDDTNGLKDLFVLGNSMPESLIKNLEDLDACIKGFMSCFSPSPLQSSDHWAGIGVTGTN